MSLAAVAAAIRDATGSDFEIAGHSSTGGGCINETRVLNGGDGSRWFVKLNRAERVNMFQAEAEGLRELDAAGALRVPRPLCHGSDGIRSWLVLEYIELSGRGDGVALGHGLAGLHKHASTRFGWHRSNTIGATHQDNTPSDDWVAFWRERRLLYQLRLAERNGIGRQCVARGEKLAAGLAGFFPGYTPVASLLHGDLWGGNVAFARGEPVLFDPAVYFGDREADIAMTELFGGFSADFRSAYHEAWPLDPGYARRRDLYNLYHVLNHFNLFGGGYGPQAASMIDRLLASLG